MSRLKDLVNTLGQVIVSYYQTQTRDTFIETPSQYSRDFYEDLINKATRAYPKRQGFLDYLLYVMDTIKPYVDKVTPLLMEEEKNISSLLTTLINNTKLLLDSSKSESIDITYAGKTVKMEGFILGISRGYSYCNTGQIINNELIVPFGLAKKDMLIEFTVKTLIDEHQQPLLAVQEIINNLQQQLLLEQTKSEALQEENRFLKTENEASKTTILSLKEQISSFKKKTDDLAEEIGCLKEQRGANPTGVARYLSFYPATATAVRAAEATTRLYPGFSSND